MKVAIIGAMAEEVAILKEAMGDYAETSIAGAKFYTGTLSGKEVILLESGIGKVNAALGTTLLCDHFKPDVLINTGSAGGIGEELQIGDVIISDRLAYGDVDATVFGYAYGQVPQMPAVYQGDTALAEKAAAIYRAKLAETANHVAFGLVITNDSFVSTEAQREQIKTFFPEVKAVEMEGTAIAQVAHQFEIPFVMIRALSDVADKEAAGDFDTFLQKASEMSSACILALLAEI
ncbi:5'-methylthioadenosine/adenosylhomocysteine nucleosidase [Listeria costaricensis]|uniref:5'-methylthioadenosine/adenosylhomocysteine nucleosidase n=1 Tax=Listeria costaricensis TaxID=2026604 RepID=UPI000C08497E|nr:5'-methylthioadenosine/adenosylhomocysteine nucleosidase [Listeria costaricensis]